MTQIMFQRKIIYLYNSLKTSKDEEENKNKFTKLFVEVDNFTKEISKEIIKARSKTTIDSWISKNMKRTQTFNFHKCKISTFTFEDGEKVFTKELFFDTSEESYNKFIDIVDKYIEYINNPKRDVAYRYIYYYDLKSNSIQYFELSEAIVKDDSKDEYDIELIPPKFYVDNYGIKAYTGILSIKDECQYISVENNLDKLTFYFKSANRYDTDKINGIMLGLTMEHLPHSVKAVLCKGILSDEELSNFYLNANAIESIVSDSKYDNFNDNIKEKYMNKFHNKLENLAEYINTSREKLSISIDSDVNLNIFHKKFNSVYEISKKIFMNNYYYVYRRRTNIKIFINSMATNNTESYIVYPVFKKDSILFDENSKRSKKLLDLIEEKATNGLKVNFIFIINKNFKQDKYFKERMNSLLDAGINIEICCKEYLDEKGTEITSYDFIYSMEEKIAMYTQASERIRKYYITKSSKRIKQFRDNFEKIKNLSTKYNEFDRCNNNQNKDLEYLEGDWFFYSYGSTKNKQDEINFYQDEITINSDKSVLYTFNNQEYFKGVLNLEFNENQYFIYMTSSQHSTLTIITMNKVDISKDIFKVMIIDKQSYSSKDMATFGIFSKDTIDIDEVKNILGIKPNEIILKENENIDNNIRKLLASKN